VGIPLFRRWMRAASSNDCAERKDDEVWAHQLGKAGGNHV
jgi:hypothetical protein